MILRKGTIKSWNNIVDRGVASVEGDEPDAVSDKFIFGRDRRAVNGPPDSPEITDRYIQEMTTPGLSIVYDDETELWGTPRSK